MGQARAAGPRPEAIDTFEQNHWLVAQIQGRPRLEKPPLPRWSIAVLILLFAVAVMSGWFGFPAASIGAGDSCLDLCSRSTNGGPRCGAGLGPGSLFDGVLHRRDAVGPATTVPLVLFTTLALGAAWRRFDDQDEALAADDRSRRRHFASWSGGRIWALSFYYALGLGFLTKGPVILLLVATTVIPYLIFSGRLAWGLRRLADPLGLVLVAILALSWPIAVLVADSSAFAGLAPGDVGENGDVAHLLEVIAGTQTWPANGPAWSSPGRSSLWLPSSCRSI